jgi:hypothetical protein
MNFQPTLKFSFRCTTASLEACGLVDAAANASTVSAATFPAVLTPIERASDSVRNVVTGRKGRVVGSMILDGLG